MKDCKAGRDHARNVLESSGSRLGLAFMAYARRCSVSCKRVRMSMSPLSLFRPLEVQLEVLSYDSSCTTFWRLGGAWNFGSVPLGLAWFEGGMRFSRLLPWFQASTKCAFVLRLSPELRTCQINQAATCRFQFLLRCWQL